MWELSTEITERQGRFVYEAQNPPNNAVNLRRRLRSPKQSRFGQCSDIGCTQSKASTSTACYEAPGLSKDICPYSKALRAYEPEPRMARALSSSYQLLHYFFYEPFSFYDIVLFMKNRISFNNSVKNTSRQFNIIFIETLSSIFWDFL